MFKSKSMIALWLIAVWMVTAAPGGGCQSCKNKQISPLVRTDLVAQDGGFGDDARVSGNKKLDTQDIQAQFDPEAVTGDSQSSVGFYQGGGYVQEGN